MNNHLILSIAFSSTTINEMFQKFVDCKSHRPDSLFPSIGKVGIMGTSRIHTYQNNLVNQYLNNFLLLREILTCVFVFLLKLNTDYLTLFNYTETLIEHYC